MQRMADPTSTGAEATKRYLQRQRSHAGAFLRSYWGLVVTAAVTALFSATGRAGIDFGYHWDEPVQFNLVNRTIIDGTLLPSGFYNYPSLTYLLSLLSAAGKVVARIGTGPPIAGTEFYLDARTVFLAVSALGGFWLYGTLRTRAGELGAAFGAATYLLSWQLAYHARWIAPDAVMAQAVALFLFAAFRTRNARLTSIQRHLPAAAAGLAAATKYQGALLLVPAIVLLVVQARGEPADLRRTLRSVALTLGTFIGVFVILTPGAVLQPRAFIDSIRFEMHHYSSTHGGFFGAFPYDVHSHLSYFAKVWRYVLFVTPSRSLAVTIALLLFAILGTRALWRHDRVLAAIVVSTPLFFSLYFSTQTVFIVRNFLFLWPFLAVLVGFGVSELLLVARVRGAALAAIGILGLALAWNGAQLITTAESIRTGAPSAGATSAAEWLGDQTPAHFAISAGARAAFRDGRVRVPSTRSSSRTTYWVTTSGEIQLSNPTLRRWPATAPGTFRDFGTGEVDFDYYPTWSGPDRILIFSPDEARKFGLRCDQLGIPSRSCSDRSTRK